MKSRGVVDPASWRRPCLDEKRKMENLDTISQQSRDVHVYRASVIFVRLVWTDIISAAVSPNIPRKNRARQHGRQWALRHTSSG